MKKKGKCQTVYARFQKRAAEHSVFGEDDLIRLGHHLALVKET
ncbi:hypothetical protein SD77_4413 [Bacillus badius]|uniref:Mobile element protein n=1 Tax=Bacillus badius TaxID=1455 RepID=A0ABR5AVG4_BACBA|nr:hypothetical protein SD77_4413 [Bacillus badius]